MKTALTLAILSTLGLAASATGAFAATYGDVATVLSATPVIERVAAPRRECVNEQVTAYDERRVARPQPQGYVAAQPAPATGAGAVLGAIIGGVIGHQFGNSSGGHDHGTAAGAVIGGLIGNGIEQSNNAEMASGGYRRAVYDVQRVPVTRDVQRCNVVNDYRDEVRGYDVRYRYGNREYTTRLAYDPGPTLPINVEVRPSFRSPATSYNRY